MKRATEKRGKGCDKWKESAWPPEKNEWEHLRLITLISAYKLAWNHEENDRLPIFFYISRGYQSRIFTYYFLIFTDIENSLEFRFFFFIIIGENSNNYQAKVDFSDVILNVTRNIYQRFLSCSNF